MTTEAVAIPTQGAPANPFQRATRKQAKARIALEGPAGYGKTYSALAIALGLVLPDQRVAFIDSEGKTASKYANGKPFDFDIIEMDPPFHPRRFVKHIADAQQFGYGAVIIDSLSHAWAGEGGTLDIVDRLAKEKYRGDSHRAWKEGTEIQQELVNAILRSKIHVIACMRTKTDYVREDRDDDGKTRTVIRKAGTKTVQRDEFDYEFDIIGRFDTPTVMTIIKSRYATLPPESIVSKPDGKFGKALLEWLSDGIVVPDAPATIEVPDAVVPQPLTPAMLNSIQAAIGGMDPEQKDKGKAAIAAKIRELGYTNWADFTSRGRDDFSSALEVAQAFAATKVEAVAG